MEPPNPDHKMTIPLQNLLYTKAKYRHGGLGLYNLMI